MQLDPSVLHQSTQHRHDFFGRHITEQLAQCFFVPFNPVLVDQLNKIPLRIARQRRFREVRVLRQERVGCAVHVGEIATATA